MGGPDRHGTWVNLYINGIYWGLYNPTEYPDSNFAADYLGRQYGRLGHGQGLRDRTAGGRRRQRERLEPVVRSRQQRRRHGPGPVDQFAGLHLDLVQLHLRHLHHHRDRHDGGGQRLLVGRERLYQRGLSFAVRRLLRDHGRQHNHLHLPIHPARKSPMPRGRHRRPTRPQQRQRPGQPGQPYACRAVPERSRVHQLHDRYGLRGEQRLAGGYESQLDCHLPIPASTACRPPPSAASSSSVGTASGAWRALGDNVLSSSGYSSWGADGHSGRGRLSAPCSSSTNSRSTPSSI